MNKKVLIVEDTFINMVIAEEVFLQAGIIVDKAENGLEGVNKCKD